MRRPSEPKLTVHLPARTQERLEDLRQRCGARSVAEVIQRSLAVFSSLTAEHEAGGRVQIVTSTGEIVPVGLPIDLAQTKPRKPRPHLKLIKGGMYQERPKSTFSRKTSRFS